MSKMVTDEIIKQIDQLPDDQQEKVLEFFRSLPGKQVIGVAGETILRFAGLIPVMSWNVWKRQLPWAME